MPPSILSTISGAESLATSMAKRERLRGRLIDKVMVEYNNLDGPPLNATGNALVASEVELLITRGALRQADIRRVAMKCKDIQYSAERESLRSGRTPMRPSTMTSIRSGMPPTPRRPPGPPPAPHTPNTLDLFMAQRGAFPAATPSAKADASATYEDAHEDAEEEVLSPSALDLRSKLFRMEPADLGPTKSRWLNQKLADAEWDAQMEKEIQEYQREHERDRIMRVQQQQQTKHDLDQQLANRLESKRREMEEEWNFHRMEEQRRQMINEQKEVEEAKARQQRMHERDRLQKQVKATQDEKKRLRDQQKAEEEEYAQLVKQDVARRRADDIAKKMQAQQEFKEFMSFNEKQLEEKKLQRTREMERDKQYMEEYAAMVEAQEKMYRDAMQEKNDKAARRVDVAAKSYFSDIWELQRKDAERANAEAKKREEALRMDEQRRKQRLQEENIRTKEFLNKQLEAKEEERKREEEESLVFRKQLEADVQLEQEMRHKQKMDARSQKKSRAKDLDEQVALNTLRMRRPLEIKIGNAASP
uniref:Trichohyalin-plectin-homology domain-containing protein n=1 Tax=Eutreptiella gymnastica TaxID=73025 RepID=A0A7S4G2N3_9EUGL|mmetsp:Transcript_63060/g.104110  ORF Transcript_63060/g.104110 Transcript_63060/m.104110 type:complete len:533 (-) Transcript_63060:1691-3289(-)|eukprot:CAMPEP_0174281546 /NCGR_PEP_ID=MMETSP0809-20121228/1911_1 /TAXON_ID=73025 ORGANISM="Eutreptiella gymnastica-like, Strain CCMP1594" /NCGR_SAMPLE_ID=MMETSP0809 /ASSEMBLY_ACC=CAM_ASM_000658 /LENGTH=532 /DNA_ID=CAMNT_0015375163 /DNA_START=97 /DNA_END=1695 /DNA_ORIENTATION=+